MKYYTTREVQGIVEPDWDNDESYKVLNWRNHVPDQIRKMWHTFTVEQQIAIYEWANNLVLAEEWDD